MEFKESNTNVCSMIHLWGFMDHNVSTVVGEPWSPEGTIPPFEVFVQQLLKMAKLWDRNIDAKFIYAYPVMKDRWDRWETKYLPKLAFVNAVTNNYSVTTNEYLDKLGFSSEGPFHKLKHPDSWLFNRTIGIDNFCKAIGYISEYDPRTPEERGY